MDGRWFIHRDILGWELMCRDGDTVTAVATFRDKIEGRGENARFIPREDLCRRVARLLTAEDAEQERQILDGSS